MDRSVSKWPHSTKLSKTMNLKRHIIPPTCSTFNNFGTIRNKIGNVAGYMDEKFFSNTHKKPFATFGLPKGHLLNHNHKDMCMTQHPLFPK